MSKGFVKVNNGNVNEDRERFEDWSIVRFEDFDNQAIVPDISKGECGENSFDDCYIDWEEPFYDGPHPTNKDPIRNVKPSVAIPPIFVPLSSSSSSSGPSSSSSISSSSNSNTPILMIDPVPIYPDPKPLPKEATLDNPKPMEVKPIIPVNPKPAVAKPKIIVEPYNSNVNGESKPEMIRDGVVEIKTDTPKDSSKNETKKGDLEVSTSLECTEGDDFCEWLKTLSDTLESETRMTEPKDKTKPTHKKIKV